MCVLVSAGGVAQTAAPAPDAPAPGGIAGEQNPPSIAQQAQAVSRGPIAPFHVELPHSHNPFDTYRASTVAPLNLNNSPRLDQLIRDGKLYLSLRDALALALEDNADLAFFRYNLPIADTDLLRTKAGGQASASTSARCNSLQAVLAAALAEEAARPIALRAAALVASCNRRSVLAPPCIPMTLS